MSTTAVAQERELADHHAANLRTRQVITSLNLATPQADEVTNVIDIDTIRADLATCSQGNAYEQWMAQEDLKDKAEQYIKRLLNEIDSLITMIRDLDEHTTRDDPAHDTELEAAASPDQCATPTNRATTPAVSRPSSPRRRKNLTSSENQCTHH